MRVFLILLALVTGLAPAASAQADLRPPVSAPVDFSGSVGFFLIEAAAAPTKVQVEDPLLLTVRIRGNAVDDYPPRRSLLRIFPDNFDSAFFLDALPERDRHMEAENTWEFVYQLRPKHTEVKEVPSLKFVYWSVQRMFQTAYSEPIPLTVLPRAEATLPHSAALDPPPGLLHIDTSARALRRLAPSRSLEPWALVLLLAAAPLLSGATYWFWRRQTSSVKQRRQSRAARAVLRKLQVHSAAANPDIVVPLLTVYLRDRFEFSVNEPTPAEVAALLRRAGTPRELWRQWEEFYREASTARFAPVADVRTDAAERAMQLIRALEECEA